MNTTLRDPGVRHAIVVSWHAQRAADLLSKAVLPEVRQLQREHPATYAERHWVKGPHVAVIVPDAEPGQVDLDDSRRRLTQAVAPLAGGPPLKEKEWLQQAAMLGKAELIEPPYGPLRPDRAVTVERYRPSSIELVGAEAYPLKERFLAAAVPAVGQTLAQGDAMGSALRLLALHGSRWPLGGIEVGQLTYRSHLEDHLHLHGGDELRAAVQTAVARHLDGARGLVAHLLQTAPDGRYDGEDPLLRSWSDLLDQSWPQALEAAASGILGYEPGEAYAAKAERLGEAEKRRWAYGENRTYSAFHEKQRSLSMLPEPVAATDFSAYRFLTNQAYRVLPLLDVTASQRYLLCALLTQAVEDVTGTTWMDLLSKAAEDASAMMGTGARA